MRRGSIIGPVLLIAIGGLFLANNVMPELSALKIAADYWPFLLIIWGLVRLLEILFWRVTGRPLPAAGIGAGEWVLIIFISLIGTGIFAANRYAGDWPRARITSRGIEVFGETHEYPASAVWKAGKTPKIVIENHRGNTRLTAADTDEIKITGRNIIRAFEQSDAARANKECPLEIVPQGDKLLVRTNQDRASGALRISSDLEIVVPRGASVEARGRYGDFDISDLGGDVDINSDNAGVRVQNIGGSVRVDLRRSDIVRAVNVKGGVDIKGRGHDVELENIAGEVTLKFPYTGEMVFRKLARSIRLATSLTELRAERVPGDIRMTRGEFIANDLVGPVRLQTKSTDVQISDFREALELQIDRGDIELRPGRTPLGRMDIRSGSGDVELTLPAGAKFALEATSRRGELHNEYGAPLRLDEQRRGGSIRGSVGSGPSIVIHTERGSITLSKSSEIARPAEAPEPPKPPKPAEPLKVERQ